jgi:hypothetical protein
LIIAAVLVALAHGLARFVRRIDHAFGRAGRAEQVRELGVDAVGGIAVAAGGGDALACGKDARPADRPSLMPSRTAGPRSPPRSRTLVKPAMSVFSA